MTTQRQRVLGYIYMCAKDILKKKWIKEESERLLLEVTSSFQAIIKVTLMALKLALEPLFFLCLEAP